MAHPEDCDDATRDALLINNPASSKEELETAWRRLIPVIEQIARRIARQLGLIRKLRRPRGSRREVDDLEYEASDPVLALSELEQEAVSHIYDKLGQFHGPKFCPWCRAVLKNLAIDLIRGREREKTTPFAPEQDGNSENPEGSVPEPAAPVYEGDQTADWRQMQHDLRQALDRLGDASESPDRGVDYFSVLLLYLRLNIVRISGQLAAESSVSCTDLAEWFLPWRDDEAARSFKAGWPTLQTIWDLLANEISCNPPPWPAERLPNLINSLNPPQPLTSDLWYQWTNRARKSAEQSLAPYELDLLRKLM